MGRPLTLKEQRGGRMGVATKAGEVTWNPPQCSCQGHPFTQEKAGGAGLRVMPAVILVIWGGRCGFDVRRSLSATVSSRFACQALSNRIRLLGPPMRSHALRKPLQSL